MAQHEAAAAAERTICNPNPELTASPTNEHGGRNEPDLVPQLDLRKHRIKSNAIVSLHRPPERKARLGVPPVPIWGMDRHTAARRGGGESMPLLRRRRTSSATKPIAEYTAMNIANTPASTNAEQQYVTSLDSGSSFFALPR
jgi:hypothetical protein